MVEVDVVVVMVVVVVGGNISIKKKEDAHVFHRSVARQRPLIHKFIQKCLLDYFRDQCSPSLQPPLRSALLRGFLKTFFFFLFYTVLSGTSGTSGIFGTCSIFRSIYLSLELFSVRTGLTF